MNDFIKEMIRIRRERMSKLERLLTDKVFYEIIGGNFEKAMEIEKQISEYMKTEESRKDLITMQNEGKFSFVKRNGTKVLLVDDLELIKE